jgi:hypothetical protein
MSSWFGSGRPDGSNAKARPKPHGGCRIADAAWRREAVALGGDPALLPTLDSLPAEPVPRLVIRPNDPLDLNFLFERIRWGGSVLVVTRSLAEARSLIAKITPETGFALDREQTVIRVPCCGLCLPFLGQKGHFFVIRRVLLLKPGQVTDRFTFDVRLIKADDPELSRQFETIGQGPAPSPGQYIVLKQVPTYGYVVQRLRQRFPDAPAETIGQRAHKLVDHVFPVFLSREAAFLRLLQRDMPAAYRARVPRPLGVQKGADGLVRKLFMTWLPAAGHPIDQLTFARQCADLLRVLHDEVGVIHLDLRLDNMVITPQGVSFVDFGSAVRVGEEISESPMLRALFDEMMSTSQIQRVLGRLKDNGRVTSDLICKAHGRVDKAVDLFYLAMQMRKPLANPDFEGLIRFDPQSPQANRIDRLTGAILRPDDPQKPAFQTARDVLDGLDRIERALSSAGV